MKLLLLILLFITLANCWSSQQLQYPSMVDGELVGSFQDKIKATKCVKEMLPEVKKILKTYQDLIHFRLFHLISDGWDLFKDLFKLPEILDNCKVFFCFGPSIKQCEANTEKTCERDGLYAYETCDEGFQGHGKHCKVGCPEGYKNRPLGLCRKPKGYGNGLGYALWDKHKCEKHNPQGCQYWGLEYFPKCKEGYYSRGPYECIVKCPEGFHNRGNYCKKPHKDNYSRKDSRVPVTVGMKCIFGKKDFSDETCEQQQDNFYQLRDHVTEIHDTAVREDRLELLDDYFINQLDESVNRYYYLKQNCNQEFQNMAELAKEFM